MFILRLPLKLLALPFVLALSLIQWAGIFLVSVSSGLLNTLLGILSLIVAGSWMLGLTSEGNVVCGLTLCLILFLLPHIAEWCIVRIAVLGSILKDFVKS